MRKVNLCVLAAVLIGLAAPARAQVSVGGGSSVVLASLAAPYTVGDVCAADTTTTLALINDVATGNVLLSGGVGTLPVYGKVGLTTHVSGILPAANGGTENGYAAFTGPTTTKKTFTLPDASATILTTNTLVTNAQFYGGATPASSTGFGTGVAGVVETGSVDFGGRVTIGTGGDTTGAVTFGGTYAVKPHCVANNETAVAAVKASASTTVLTLTGTFTAADTVTWVCR